MRILFCVGNLIFLVSPEAVIRVKIATVTYPILILETEHISASGTIEKTMHSIRSDLEPAWFWPRLATPRCGGGSQKVRHTPRHSYHALDDEQQEQTTS